MIGDTLPSSMQGIDDAAGVDRVPVDDGGDNQVEGGCPYRKVFLASITKAAKAMEIDAARPIRHVRFGDNLPALNFLELGDFGIGITALI